MSPVYTRRQDNNSLDRTGDAAADARDNGDADSKNAW